MRDVTPRFKTGKPRKPSKRSLEDKWRNDVRESQGWKCQFPGCPYAGPEVQAHHRQTKKQRPDLVYDVANGVSLCGPFVNDHHAWTHAHPIEATELGLLGGERYEKAQRRS